MAETDAALIGIESCGCVTYANARPDELDRDDQRMIARILAAGGQAIRTTVGEARARANFLPTECPHRPKGWERDRPREKKPEDRLRYRRVSSRNVSRVSVVIEPNTVAGPSSWPKGISAGEVGKRNGGWYATPGWLDTYKAEATDGRDPRGPEEVLGPFHSQREAALVLIPHAERFAAEISGALRRVSAKRLG